VRDFEIVDAHVHLYRDIEKEKQALPIPGRRDRDRWGNADSIVPYMDREGVSTVVGLNFYPTGVMRRVLRSRIPGELTRTEREDAERAVERDLAAGVRRQNEWLCTLANRTGRILAGIGVQKLLSPEELVEEVELRAGQGARTVKMIPGWFHEYPNDRAFWPMYQRCAELGLAITSDTGTVGLGVHSSHPGEHNPICYGEPVHFQEVLEAFPKLTLVMCHFASAFWDQRVALARRYPNLVFDISGGFAAPHLDARDGDRALVEEDAVRVMRKVGVERMMFGSDGPHVMLQPYLEQFLRLDLTDNERQLILADNAKRIYRIS
jgi:predicted TIM-barrel fold metal-dependent hydrolase